MKGSGARLPDGKGQWTIGYRYSTNFELNVPAADNDGLAFFPGYNCVTCAVGDVNAKQVNESLPKLVSNGPLIQQNTTGDQVAHWRTISAGLRLTLLNNADQNDGWFEAIRIKLSDSLSSNWWEPSSGAGATLKSCSPGLAAQEPWDANYAVSATWINHPSYMSGRTRDLHRYMFSLSSSANDHDFVNLPQQEGVTDLATEPNPLFDKSFDMILIKIHNTNPLAPQKFLVHSVNNLEMGFTEVSLTASTHLPGYYDKMCNPTYGRVLAAAVPFGNESQMFKSYRRRPRRMNRYRY